MKTPIYEASVGAMSALLAGRAFVFGDLYTITLANNNGTLRLCSGDTDWAFGGNAWGHGGPLVDTAGQRPRAHWKTGLDTDTWQFSLIPRPVHPTTGAAWPDLIGNVPWLQAIVAGSLEGATVQVDRAYLPSWPPFPRAQALAPTGVLTIFVGRVAAVDIDRTIAHVSLNSHIDILSNYMPRNLFQAGCRLTLFSNRCTLAASAYAVACTAQGSSSQRAPVAAVGLPGGSATYVLGRVTFTGGNNASFTRSIRTAVTAAGVTTFTLIAPLPFPVVAGDTFTAYPGCDKKLATCVAFGNSANFNGTDLIPAPETAV
jgi:hypothetical protein